MFPWIKLVEYAGIAVFGAIMSFMGTRLYYTAQIANLKSAHAQQVAAALAETAKEQAKQRQIESQAAQAAREVQDAHDTRTEALEAANAALAADGNKLRNTNAVLAKRLGGVGQDTAATKKLNDDAARCWKLLDRSQGLARAATEAIGGYDGLAERCAAGAGEFAEQIKTAQEYAKLLKPFQ